MATRNAATAFTDDQQSATIASKHEGETLYSSGGQPTRLTTNSFGTTTITSDDRFAASARHAGRVIARRTTKEEYDGLIDKHRALAVKEVTGTLTKSEKTQLVMIRWNIDRIEDAMYGDELDKLEAIAASHQALAREVKVLVDWTEHQQETRRGRR